MHVREDLAHGPSNIVAVPMQRQETHEIAFLLHHGNFDITYFANGLSEFGTETRVIDNRISLLEVSPSLELFRCEFSC